MDLDIHLVKGHSHNICEDYGIVNPYKQFMIIADGCSTGYHSDVASRILVHACKNELIRHWEKKTVPTYSSLRREILASALAASKVLGLGDLLSTLLVAFKHPYEDQILVYVYGDGYIVHKFKDQPARCVHKIDFNFNAPNYLWYQVDPSKYSINDANAVERYTEDGFEFGKVGMDRNYEFVYTFDTKAIEYVGILTDGVASFISNKPIPDSKFGTSISDEDAIKHLFCFKNTTGEFVKRRMKRFVKEVKVNGFTFDDDITCAVMVMGADDESIS